MFSKFNLATLRKTSRNTLSVDLGILMLRLYTGLALCTVFEKFLPRDGVWGPQPWFISDVQNMGLPFPELCAWLAVSIEFFGGILLLMGMLTRLMAFLNVLVLGAATFIHHGGDVANSGIMSMTFMIMCVSLCFLGGGKFSLDNLLKGKMILARKHGILFVLVWLSSVSGLLASPALGDSTQAVEVIEFRLYNNSVLPKKATLISYIPGRQGNKTNVTVFMPFQKKKYAFPIGTKIYLANAKQVDSVMGGQRIDADLPFLKVDASLKNKRIKLFE